MAHHHCSATPLLAKCSAYRLVLLCKTGSQQAYDTANTLVEICSSYRCAVAHYHCSATLLSARCSAYCCCAKQADSRLLTLQMHFWRFDLHIGVQWPSTSADPHCFWQNAVLIAYCCCAKQADSRLVTLQIHLWRFAPHTGVQWHNTSAVPHCFWQNAVLIAAVQNRLAAGL